MPLKTRSLSETMSTTVGEERHESLAHYGLLIVVIPILIVVAYRIFLLAIYKVFVPYALHRLARHALNLVERFEGTGDLSSLSNAISTMQTVIRLTPDGAHLIECLIHLGRWLDTRYDRTQDVEDLNEYIAAQQRLVLLTPEDDPNFPAILHNVGLSFHSRFERTRQFTDLSEAVSAKQISVQATPEDHPVLPSRLQSLAYSFEAQFEATGNISDSDGAISSRKRIVDLKQDDDARLPQLLNGLGNSYDLRFKTTQNIFDIDEAVACKKTGISRAGDDHPDLFRILNSLGISYLHRFRLTNDICDNTNSIATMEQCISLAPEGDNRVPRLLSQLGCAYQILFDRIAAEMSLIDKAIAVQQKSLELSSARSPDLFYNLGTSFLSRFARSGDVADVAEAIVHFERSLELIDDGDDFLPQVLSSLATSFNSRFGYSRHLQDIDRAISLAERVIKIRGDGHPDLPAVLSDLGCFLQSRFLQSRFLNDPSCSDIDAAISVHQKAVELTPAGHADLPGHLSNLAGSYNVRHAFDGEISYINKAISMYQAAVELMPRKRHPFTPTLYQNLSIAFASRFAPWGDVADIDEAVSAGRLALDLTPEGHADLHNRLISLGNVLHVRSALKGHEDDLDLCVLHYKKAAMSGLGDPWSRFRAARKWANTLAGHFPESPDIIPAFDTAIRALTLVAGLEQTVQHRYIQLEGISGFTLEAAAEAFRLGRPEKALEWLEQGRCTVWNQVHSLRTPVDELSVHHSELAQRLSTLAGQLDVAGCSTPPSKAAMSLSNKTVIQDVARAHITLAKQWQSVLEEVRGKYGFHDFLCPPQASRLVENLPPGGYVVVINVSNVTCDAACVSRALPGPLHIPLPDFSSRKADRYLVDLRTRLARSGIAGRPDDPADEESADKDLVRKILQGLWKGLVKPILDALEISVSELMSNLYHQFSPEPTVSMHQIHGVTQPIEVHILRCNSLPPSDAQASLTHVNDGLGLFAAITQGAPCALLPDRAGDRELSRLGCPSQSMYLIGSTSIDRP